VNRSFCNNCGALVPGDCQDRDSKVYLVKNCPACGKTETLIASDASRYWAKRNLDTGYEYRGCEVNCETCPHANAAPSFAFVDVTNRCNMNCPVCCDNVPSMGFRFDPPMEYFGRLFGHLARQEPRPTVALFGGEPTVREDLFDIIALSRRHGLKTRVVTNGIRMADADYCDRLLATRATILLSYDGARPETYRRLRGSDRSLAPKQRAIENIEHSPNLRPGRIYLITCIAKGVNDSEMPELLDFYHSRRRFISTVHFMPLAHTWEDSTGSETDRITTEDIEKLVADVYPADTAEFLPAGFVAQLALVSTLVSRTALPFLGAHPNCESVYALVSNGEQYVPISRYLRGTLVELAQDLMRLEQRLSGPASLDVGNAAPCRGLRSFALKVRTCSAMAPLILRRVRFDRLLKGRSLAKVWHGLALAGNLLVGRQLRRALADHTNAQGVLQLIILPFEDNYVLETERLERCPSVHVYLDPRTNQVHSVPVCAWRLFNRKVMSEIAEHYGAAPEPAGKDAAS
jgi:hypothetical protein